MDTHNDNDARIFQLRQQGLSRKEIASLTGKSVRQVKRSLYRYSQQKKGVASNIPTPSAEWLAKYVYSPEQHRAITSQVESLVFTGGPPFQVLHISDLHVPFHDTEAIEQAIDYAKKHKIRGFILNGDTFDLHDLSEFRRDGTVGLQTEIHYGQALLKYLINEFEWGVINRGNHDDRLQRYVMAKAAELEPVVQSDIVETIAQPFDRVIYSHNWFTKVGSVIFAHPTKYYSIPGKTVKEVSDWFARYNVFHTAVIIGHTHHIVQMIHGYKYLAEAGCLQRPMKWKVDGTIPGPPWTLGFAHIVWTPDKHIDYVATRIIPLLKNNDLLA